LQLVRRSRKGRLLEPRRSTGTARQEEIMGKQRYGALRGRVVASAEERNDHTSPHYQILAMADGEPWRIAVNVKSTDKGGSGPDRSILLYRIVDDLRHPILQTVKQFDEGLNPIASGFRNGGLDYIRGHLFDPKDMRLLPPDLPGDGNDLNDLIDAQVERAKADPNAVIFAFGQPWGPENKSDQTFKFKPNRGVHDIHMNQGNPRAGGHAGDNGVWHDGGLLFWFPGADRWVAVFLAFQSQSWHTDDQTGDPIAGKTGAEPALFDKKSRRLPALEQIHPTIDIVAVRMLPTSRSPAAVLLLTTTDQDVSLTEWSLATSGDGTQSLAGVLRAGQALAIEVAKTVFDPVGGVATLLDAAGLKVASAIYPSATDARSGWIKVG
jgi:uncharacterized protein YukJ